MGKTFSTSINVYAIFLSHDEAAVTGSAASRADTNVLPDAWSSVCYYRDIRISAHTRNKYIKGVLFRKPVAFVTAIELTQTISAKYQNRDNG